MLYRKVYSIRGKISLLLKSYLGEKKQFVSFGGYELTCENIDVRVPLGVFNI